MSNYKFEIDSIGEEILSNETKVTYNNIIGIMSRKYKAYMSDIMMSPDKYSGYIDEEVNIKSRMLYYNTILALFKHLDRRDSDEYKEWVKLSMRTREEDRKNEMDHVLTERQRKGYIRWEDVLKKRDELEIGSLNHLLLTLYISFTRRQSDYASVRIYKRGEEVDEKVSYINLRPVDGSKAYIHIVKYKTVKEHGIFEEDLPDILLESLSVSLDMEPRDYLFGNYVKGNSYQKWCNRQLKEIFNNKDISVNSLRHSISNYINSIDKIKYGEREGYARRMGHSVVSQLKYELHMDNENE